MSDNKPEISGASIILLGSFNPSIFQPMWFAAHNLISKQEGESAGTRVVHAQVSSFSVGDWLELQVTEERFAASTLQEPSFEPLCDLVLGTFQLLRHTPIQKMGLNREFHFRMSSEKEWNKVGAG